MVVKSGKKQFKSFTLIAITILVVLFQSACTPQASEHFVSSLENQKDMPAILEKASSQTLHSEEIPPVNYRDLYSRLFGRPNIPETLGVKPTQFVVGELSEFNVIDERSSSSQKTVFFLCSISPHLYLWVEQGIACSQENGNAVTFEFEDNIYPALRNVFGEEPFPGIDLDEHIYILYTSKVADDTGGYFSSADEYHPLANPMSNGHETIVINTMIPLGSDDFFHVLSHEFQHMIHWNYDPNEIDFINEGLSELAASLAGYPPKYNESFFEKGHSISIMDWENSNVDNPEIYYHGAFLFSKYLTENYGVELIQKIVEQPANGLVGLAAALEELQIMSPDSGILLTADDVFWNWQLSLVQYQIESDKGLSPDGLLSSEGDSFSMSLGSYALSVVGVDPNNDLPVSILGDLNAVTLLALPHSGNYSLWTKGANMSNPMATKMFDLDGIDSPYLSYWIWYDTEPFYDFVYVSISSDGGNTWSILNKNHCDHAGAQDCLGYSGSSNGWVYEENNLSDYTGRQVLLRFEYVTDQHTLGPGVMIDDVSVSGSEITSFEDESDAWDLSGFSISPYKKDQSYRIASVCASSLPVLVVDHGIIADGEVTTLPSTNCSDIFTLLSPIIDSNTMNTVQFYPKANP